jgi:hypothetical protein
MGDHLFVAMSWYSWRIVMTLAASVSIWSLVVVSLVSMVVAIIMVSFVVVVVMRLPSRYRSIKFYENGSINGEWILMVGIGKLCFGFSCWMSPIWDRSGARALWSPYSGYVL